MKHVYVMLKLEQDDVKWLEEIYGDKWMERMEQHIHAEIVLRRHDALKMREPWDY